MDNNVVVLFASLVGMVIFLLSSTLILGWRLDKYRFKCLELEIELTKLKTNTLSSALCRIKERTNENLELNEKDK